MMNLKDQLRHGIKSLNFIYQIFKITLKIFLKHGQKIIVQ